MSKSQGMLIEDVKTRVMRDNTEDIERIWVNIDQANGKRCSGLLCNYESLEYCSLHEEELVKGRVIEMRGVMISRKDCDFMIIDSGIGIRILNDNEQQGNR